MCSRHAPSLRVLVACGIGLAMCVGMLVLLVARRYSIGEIPVYPHATNSTIQKGSVNNDYAVITTTFQTIDASSVVAHYYDVELQQRGFSSEANIKGAKGDYLNFVRMVERFPLSSFFTIKPYLIKSITVVTQPVGTKLTMVQVIEEEFLSYPAHSIDKTLPSLTP